MVKEEVVVVATGKRLNRQNQAKTWPKQVEPGKKTKIYCLNKEANYIDSWTENGKLMALGNLN